jgi:hypothetical protein
MMIVVVNVMLLARCEARLLRAVAGDRMDGNPAPDAEVSIRRQRASAG